MAFNGFDGNDREIFRYDGESGIVTEITDNGIDDGVPGISGSNLAWSARVSRSSFLQDIFFNDGTTETITQLRHSTWR